MNQIIRFLIVVLVFSQLVFDAYTQDGSMSEAQLMELYQKSKTTSTAPGVVTTPVLSQNSSSERTVNVDAIVAPQPSNSSKESSIFGSSIFRNSKIVFEPNLKLPTPKNYILGTGDELHIDITGFASVSYIAKVSAEGIIKVENLNPIYVSGLTIEQAKERIVNRLKTIFSSLGNPKSGLSAEVTLGNIRSIKVMMIGEIVQPGTYTLPSLASVFNALHASGGPTDNGSFRNIEIYRGGKPFKKLDIYDFLLKGDQRNNIILQDQDVIRIPFFKKHVSITGNVKSAHTYELEEGENLNTVIELSGGFTSNAYTKSLNVDRINKTEREIITVLQKDFSTFVLNQGDIIKIGEVREFFNNKVIVSGAVYRGGEYALEEAKTVKGLIQLAGGLTEDVFLNRATIKRFDTTNYEPTIFAFDLAKVMRGEIADIKLVRTDILIINSIPQLREERTVSISGEVVNPSSIPYRENLTISDLVLLAGGLREGANTQYIEIARRNKDIESLLSNANTKIIKLSIDAALKPNSTDAKWIVEPFDQIIVRSLPNYETQQMVSISGEVLYPGSYAIQNRTERVSDLIKRAGGLRDGAHLHGGRLVHGGKTLGIDLKDIVEFPNSINNLLLLEGDKLFVPRLKETVDIAGQVLNPTSVVYSADFKLKDYINQAGGYTDSVDKKRIFVRYVNGTAAQTHSFLWFKKYPKIEQGAEIIIPFRKRKQRDKLTISESISILTGSATVLTLIFTLLRLQNNTN